MIAAYDGKVLETMLTRDQDAELNSAALEIDD